MELERTGGAELTEFVTDHGLGDVYRDVLAAIVDGESVADHVGNDRRATGPGLDDLAFAGLVLGVDLLEQMLVDEWAFFETACHVSVLLSQAAAISGGHVLNDDDG